MSKEFKTQDYFRYKRLGKRWRRPVGWQSKLRLRKGGSGRKVSIGFGSPKEGELDEIITVRNVNDVILAKGRPIRIASSVGAKGTLAIAQKAKELDSRIVNAKKAKRALKISKHIADKKTKKKKDEEKKKEEHKSETGKKENKSDKINAEHESTTKAVTDKK